MNNLILPTKQPLLAVFQGTLPTLCPKKGPIMPFKKNYARKNVSIYPFLYGVGLTDGSLCSGNAAGDATVALAHAPEFTADFLCVCE